MHVSGKPYDYIATLWPCELKLIEWLNLCYLPYVYLDQSQETKTTYGWPNKFKRPDFIVSLPSLGPIIIDTKARSLENGISLEVDEVFLLAEFGRTFLMPTIILYFDETNLNQAYFCHPSQFTFGRKNLKKARKLKQGFAEWYGRSKQTYFLNIDQTVPITLNGQTDHQLTFISKIVETQKLVSTYGSV